MHYYLKINIINTIFIYSIYIQFISVTEVFMIQGSQSDRINKGKI